MRLHQYRLGGAILATLLLTALTAGGAAAHVIEPAGPNSIEVGWQHEPTYVGEANGVQIVIQTADGKPVTDLGPDDLTVIVSTGGDQTSPLSFEPGFDPVEMEGPLGEYDAPIVPTAPGDYTFHVTGTIHGASVDFTVTSGAETFDPVRDPSELQFPAKLPAMGEVATRLDRVDGRITALGDPTTGAQAALTAALDAKSAADRALLVGAGIGLLGVIVGGIGVVLALRRGRPTRP